MAESAVMKKLRERMKVIFIVVIVVFVGSMVFQRGLGGVNKKPDKNVNAMAVINDEPIEYKDYSQAVTNAISQARENNPQLTEGFITQVRERTWQDLVNSILLREQIEEKHIDITQLEVNEEVRRNPPDFLKNQPNFQTDGRFDYQKFLAYVNGPQADARLVSNLRSNIYDRVSQSKLKQHVNNMTYITRHAALEEVIRNATEVEAEFLKFSAEEYKDSIREPSNEQLKKYFEAKKNNYDMEKGFVLGHCLVKLEVLPRDSALAKGKIDTIYAEVLKGEEDFSFLATQHSQDPSAAQNQGNIGWITRGRLVPEFENVVFDMDSGEVSEPFLSQYGWHVAMINGKIDSLEAINVSHILVKIEPSFETYDSVTVLAGDIQVMATEDGLEKAAKKSGSEYEKSSIIHKNDPIPGLGFYSLLNNLAANDTVGTVYDVVPSQDGYHVYQLLSSIDAGIPELSQIRDLVRDDYILDVAKNMAIREAQAAHGEIVEAGGFKQAGFKPDTLSGSPYMFRPGQGFDPSFTGTLIGLPENKISPVIEGSHAAYYIVNVKERTSPTREEIGSLIDQYHRQMLQQSKQQSFEQWFTNIRDNADISDRRYKIWRR